MRRTDARVVALLLVTLGAVAMGTALLVANPAPRVDTAGREQASPSGPASPATHTRAGNLTTPTAREADPSPSATPAGPRCPYRGQGGRADRWEISTDLGGQARYLNGDTPARRHILIASVEHVLPARWDTPDGCAPPAGKARDGSARIYTPLELEVERVLVNGLRAPEDVGYALHGGTADGHTLVWTGDAPVQRVVEGQRYLLLTHRDRIPGRLMLTDALPIDARDRLRWPGGHEEPLAAVVGRLERWAAVGGGKGVAGPALTPTPTPTLPGDPRGADVLGLDAGVTAIGVSVRMEAGISGRNGWWEAARIEERALVDRLVAMALESPADERLVSHSGPPPSHSLTFYRRDGGEVTAENVFGALDSIRVPEEFWAAVFAALPKVGRSGGLEVSAQSAREVASAQARKLGEEYPLLVDLSLAPYAEQRRRLGSLRGAAPLHASFGAVPDAETLVWLVQQSGGFRAQRARGAEVRRGTLAVLVAADTDRPVGAVFAPATPESEWLDVAVRLRREGVMLERAPEPPDISEEQAIEIARRGLEGHELTGPLRAAHWLGSQHGRRKAPVWVVVADENAERSWYGERLADPRARVFVFIESGTGRHLATFEQGYYVDGPSPSHQLFFYGAPPSPDPTVGKEEP